MVAEAAAAAEEARRHGWQEEQRQELRKKGYQQKRRQQLRNRWEVSPTDEDPGGAWDLGSGRKRKLRPRKLPKRKKRLRSGILREGRSYKMPRR